jgi:chorismate mutase/prephenate dehydratase
MTIAYLGPPGTYSHLAARAFGGDSATLVSETNLGAIFDSVRRGRAEYGVVPLENSTEGSVAGVLEALLEGGAMIQRELVLPIEHRLLGRTPVLEEITRVYSHPQALAQCRRWLASHLPQAELFPVASTAFAVRESLGDVKSAAIAGPLASELYGAPVIREGIQDLASNATRFVLISRSDAPRTGNDRTTLAFSIADAEQRGSLRRTLAMLDEHGVNMTRIESRPSRDRAWHYVFVVDVDGHREDVHVAAAIQALGASCPRLCILGSYSRDPRATL